MKTITTIIAAACLAVTMAAPAGAVTCGDVDGDSDVTAKDALMVLSEAVGIDAGLYCDGPPTTTTSTTSTTTTTLPAQARNRVRLYNGLLCNGGAFWATITDKASGQSWRAASEQYSKWQDYNEPAMGSFTLDAQNCGQFDFVGTIALPPNVDVLMDLKIAPDGVNLYLELWNMGPIGSNNQGAALGARVPLATLTTAD